MKPEWFLVVRKQFDVIGLTVENGWSDERVREFIKKPEWYNDYTWTEEQRNEWAAYTKSVYKCRDHDVDLIDLHHGWKDGVVYANKKEEQK